MKLADAQEGFLKAAECADSAAIVAAAASHVRYPPCLSQES